MKRKIRILLPMLVTLALVVSMVAMAAPALASQIEATKSTNPVDPNIYHVGDTIYYEMTVTNPLGNPATNTITDVWDTLPDGSVVYFIQSVIDPPLVQAPGDTETFYISYVVDAADIVYIPALGDDGVKNKFEAMGYDSAGDDVYALVTRNSNIVQPCIDIQKTVDCNNDGIFSDEETWYAGDTGHWKVVVTNCGDATLSDVWVSDNNSGYLETGLVLAPGESKTYEYDTVVNEDTTNWAWADGFDVIGGYVYDEDDATNLVISPCIDIQKTVDCNNDGVFSDEETWYAGDIGHWKVIVTNCGDVDLYDVVVTDDNGFDFGLPFDLAAGDFVEFNYDTVVDVDTTNVAYVEGYDELGGAWYDEDGATNLVITPCIDIEKTVDCNNDGVFLDEDMGYAGDTGHWKVVVTNCGDVDLYDVVVTDDNGFDFGLPFDLAAGDFVEFNYDTVVDVDTTNWAYVVGYDEMGGAWYDEDDATNLVIQPCIDIDKTVDCNDDGVFLDEDTGTSGDTGHWRIVVTNCGDADLFDVMVTDTNGQSFGPFDLAAGDSEQFDYDTVVNETTTNTADVVGYDELGGAWYDEDSATNVVTGGEGCTPGFWKENALKHDAVAWVGYSPDDLFSDVFGEVITIRTGGKQSNTITDPTLIEALQANGSGINLLARSAVAALLNASNPNVDYPMGEGAIISAVQAAIASGDANAIQALGEELDEYNNLGCSINQQGDPILDDGIVI